MSQFTQTSHELTMAIEAFLMTWLGPIFVVLILVIAIWMLLYGPRMSRRST